MAEATYYFDSRSTGNWSDPDNMINGELGDYASTAADGTVETLDGNTCPGDDLGAITKVELRVYGYGDGDDRIDTKPFAGEEYQHTMPSSPGWSSYADATAEGWTWASVRDTDMWVEFDKVGKGNTMHCAKVEIRVTYTPSGAYYHGLKVETVGELALCDVGNHPLRMRKGGVTYGIELVAVDDPNASRIRVETGAGLKAIRKYT